MLRVNVSVSKALDHQYEEKLIAKVVGSYSPRKYRKTKSKASTATNLMYDSAHSVDIFLSQTQDELVSSEYLADEEYFILEDNAESDEEKVEVDEGQVGLNEE